MQATGGLAAVRVPADASSAGHAVATKVALLPLMMNGARLPLRTGPPALGQHTRSLLHSLGYGAAEIEQLQTSGVVLNAVTP